MEKVFVCRTDGKTIFTSSTLQQEIDDWVNELRTQIYMYKFIVNFTSIIL